MDGSRLMDPEISKILKGKNFASFATLMNDGSPQVTPVWVDYRDDLILVNTAVGRLKEKNIDRDNRVALCVFETENPYNMVSIKGRVVDKRTEGADKHIDELAKRYLNVDKYPYRRPDEKRVILKIMPEKIFHLKI